jgi:TPR repeat protein
VGFFTRPERARFDAAAYSLLFFVVVMPVGLAILLGSFVYRHVDIRMRPSKSACKHGDAAACVAVGEAYVEQGGGPYKNDAVAEEYLDRGCTLGSAVACNRLGWVYVNTDDETFSNDKAASAWSKACQAKVGEACNALGNLQMAQLQDDRKAIEAFAAGCALDVMEACYWQGVLLINGEGVPHDVARGRQLAAKACAAGFKKACPSAK